MSGHEGAEVLRLSRVEPEAVEWLWEGYVPLGTLTVLDGDPGLGKSTLVLDLASRLSRGDAMPDGSDGPSAAGTVLLSAEDDLARVIRPRLDAAGADLDRVAVLRLRDAEGDLREPTLSPDDLAKVERAVREVGARLVIVDPLMAYLPQDVDAHRDQDVRRPLSALRALAERTGAAVIIVRHLNKSPGGSPLYRGGGSIGIVAAARSGLVLAAEPRDPTGSVRVLASVKSNLAPAPPSLRLRLVKDPGSAFARVSWEGASTHSAASLLAPPPEVDRSEADEAEDFLRELLAAGPMPARDVDREAKSAGLRNTKALRLARERLSIVPRKAGRPGEAGQHWTWALPEDALACGAEAPKMPSDAERGHLREGEPRASTCESERAEDALTGGNEQVRRGAPKVPSSPGAGHLRANGDANSVSVADVAEDAQAAVAWTSSEPAPGTAGHLRGAVAEESESPGEVPGA